MPSTTLPDTQSSQPSVTIPPATAGHWHKMAPRALRRLGEPPHSAAAWAIWKKHVSQRKPPAPLAQGDRARLEALFWGLEDREELAPVAEWARGMRRRLARRQDLGQELAADVQQWLETSAGVRPHDALALEALVWAHALPGLMRPLPRQLWWRLLGGLVELVDEARRDERPDQPLVGQLLGGELALTLAGLFPEYHPCRALAGVARAALVEGASQLVTPDGWPSPGLLPLVRPLLACWVRCRELGRALGKGQQSQPPRKLLRRLLHAALRLTRADGSPALGGRRSAPRGFWSTAAAVAGGRAARRGVRFVLGEQPRHKRRRRRGCGLAAGHSAAAELAVLGQDQRPTSPRVTVDYHQASVQLEISLGGRQVFAGPWSADVERNGQPLAAGGRWEEVCWESDRRVVYLELERPLAGGARLQRQLLLAREEKFLLLADAVLDAEPGTISYQSSFRLADELEVRCASATHEAWLAAGKRRLLVLPLALPEWRSDARRGELAGGAGVLQCSLVASGTCLYAPLWIDLSRSRRARPFTWRRLTVAQQRQNLASDAAAAYRVQVGRRQWLFYRPLANQGVHSVLGQNVHGSFLTARFHRSGKTRPLLDLAAQ